MSDTGDLEKSDFLRSLTAGTFHDEHIEEAHSISPEVTSSEFLQCGDIITRNMKAAADGLQQMTASVCGVVADRSEAEKISGTLKEARDVLVITMGHIDSALMSIDDALILFYRCLNGKANSQWDKLPVYLAEFRDHSRHAQDLWPRNRTYLNQELLPSLSDHFYSTQSVLPHAALWVAQITGSEQFFPRLRVWGQLPALIAGICAAFDPISQFLDKLETYAGDLSDRLQLVASRSTGIKDAKKMLPALSQIRARWGSQFDRLHRQFYVFKDIQPSRHLPISMGRT